MAMKKTSLQKLLKKLKKEENLWTTKKFLMNRQN